MRRRAGRSEYRLEAAVERLEERTLLTTQLFLDFGAGFAAAGMTDAPTVQEFRDIFGNGTGTDMTQSTKAHVGMNGSDVLNFARLNYDFDGNGVAGEVADAQALAAAVVPIVERAMEPFDIDVVAAAASDLADAVTAVTANNGDASGEFDAYNFIADITSTALTSFGGSVGDNFRLFGRAAGEDLDDQTGNDTDEATMSFADNVLGSISDPPGDPGFNRAEFNQALAFRIAYTATHEAFHTFTLVHTTGFSGNVAGQTLLTSGDVIRFGSVTREDPFIVTRFDLQRQNGVSVDEPNNYLQIANDSDIGLSDSDADGIPDLAYVTGTGAHDRITLADGAGNTIDVTVQAYEGAAKTSLIATNSYTIDLDTDTEGTILIDASINSDEVIIDGSIDANFRVRGGTGEDGVSSATDELIVNGDNTATLRVTPTDIDSGSITVTGGATIVFDEFEALTNDGGTGDDTMIVDFISSTNSVAMTFNGGAGFNDLELANGTFNTVEHTFTSAHDGSVRLDVDGAVAASFITYAGLAPIYDNLSVTDRVFTFSGGSETVTVSDAFFGSTGIDSTLGESVTFVNPTGTLTINTGTGDDTINIGSFNSSYHASLTINGGAGNDTVNLPSVIDVPIAFNGGSGSDEAAITADAITIGITGSIDVGPDALTLRPNTSGTKIDLGGPDTFDTLGLTDDELDRIIAGTLIIGDLNSGEFTVSGDITHPTIADFELISGGDIILNSGLLNTGGGTLLFDANSVLRPVTPDIDVIASNVTFASGTDVEIAINGETVDTTRSQLNVAGTVDLTGTNLLLSGSYTPQRADSFVIVNNDGNDAVVGTFAGLPEGEIVHFNGAVWWISYVGGDGNDVTLTDVAVGLVTAPQAGYPPLIRVYDGRPQGIELSFYAYSPLFRGGIDVATGDVNGDGVIDIITVPESGNGAAHVRVFDGVSGAILQQFMAFTPKLRVGFHVAAGDVDGDGFSDIIVSTRAGVPGTIRVFDGETGNLDLEFRPYGTYRGGVKIATGDVDGDDADEILTIPAGQLALADVRVFDGTTGNLESQFLAWPSHVWRPTHNITTGDVNEDGNADIIVSIAGAGPSTVRVFDGTDNSMIKAFRAYGRFRGGVSVATGDVDFDGRAEIITAPESSVFSAVRFYDGQTGEFLWVPDRPYQKSFTGGTNLAGQSYGPLGSLVLEGQVIADSNEPALQTAPAEAMLAAAIQRFRAAGFSRNVTDRLAETEIRIVDLAGGQLGRALAGTIVLDVNAAGWGWFNDETPLQNEEFLPSGHDELEASAASAQNKVDLLSVLTHELGHVLGLDDATAGEAEHAIMTATLAPGIRRVTHENLADLFEESELMDELLMS